MSTRSLASVAAVFVLLACQAPSPASNSAPVDPKPAALPNPVPVPEGQSKPDEVGGTQLGDDGTATPPVPPCAGGMVGIGDQDVALRGQEATPRQWRDSLTSEQTGVATVHFEVEGQICAVRVNYELTTRPANEQLWWYYSTSEVVDAKCRAPQEYVIEDVAVTLELDGILMVDASLVGMTHTPKDGDANTTLSIRTIGVPAQANKPSRYTFSAQGLEAACDERGVSGEATTQPPNFEDAGWATYSGDHDGGGIKPPYVGASCIECLQHTCSYDVEQCQAASDCSPFTQCADDCGEDAACSGACPEPACDTGTEPGCWLLDCRNWICDEVCGQPPFGGVPNQVYEHTDAGPLDDVSTSASVETETPAWTELQAKAFSLTRSEEPDSTWSATFEFVRLTVEF